MWGNKIILFASLLFLFSNAHAVTVLDDNFNDGTITDWDQNFGTWTAASFFLDGGGADQSAISHTVSMPTDVNYLLNYRVKQTANGLQSKFFWFTNSTGIVPGGSGVINGYVIILSNTSGLLQRYTPGVGTTLINFGGVASGAYHDVNITHTLDGNISVYLDGSYKGSATDTTYSTGTRIIFAAENTVTDNINVDDVNITRTAQVNPTISADYNGFGTATDTKKYVNVLNYNVQHKCFSGPGVIERYINSINDLNYPASCVGVDQNIFGSYSHPVNGANFKIHFRIEDLGAFTNASTADVNFYADINAPFADLNSSASTNSFTLGGGIVQLNLTCLEETSPQVDYNITDQISYLSGRFNANTTQSVNVSLAGSNELFHGSCTDLAGNQNVDFNIVTVQVNCFKLVDETSGVTLTAADIINLGGLTASSYHTKVVYNFKLTNNPNICFTGNNGDTIRFDINYSDGTQLFREFNQDILTNYDTNISVCVADLQSFFEQDFTSSKNTPIILRHQISQCFNTADYTKYAEGDALSLRAFTIVGPYQMETFDDDGNKIILSQINGGTPSGIQVDLLKFKLGTVPDDILGDFLGISLFLAPGQTDSNTLKIYYLNYKNDNASVNIKITDDSNTIFDYTETTNPNLFVVYFDHTTIPIDGNFLTITLTKIKTDLSSETEVKYVSLNGIVQSAKKALASAEPLAAIVAIIVFIFGFTMVAPKFALGWVGVIVSLISLAVLTLAAQAWYIIWLQAVFLIIAMYLAVGYKDVHAAVS